ncbi:probable calcium-binding protein CML21 [Phragmites australis]|uniref:probable calcium-binding protein CML21 n=1 Tax=Phragmites australis TaxID=29695 RepID=UPI002D784EBF|nr:probable calcium-binding protein CML21 [Phragmites australis]
MASQAKGQAGAAGSRLPCRDGSDVATDASTGDRNGPAPEEAVKIIDISKEGKEEDDAILKTSCRKNKEEMREAFRVFDEDGDSYISAAELQAVLARMGLPEAGCMTRVRDMIAAADRDRDDRVDFDEFEVIWPVALMSS